MFLTPTQINLSKFRIFLFYKKEKCWWLNLGANSEWQDHGDENAHPNHICKLQAVTNTRRQNLTWFYIIYQRT